MKKNAPLGFCRMIVPRANCAVLFDMNDDATIALIAKWIMAGESQSQVARRLGYHGSSILSVRLRRFIERYAGNTIKYGAPTVTYLPAALKNFSAAPVVCNG